MGKGTKELLHKILSNQKLIMDQLKITVPAVATAKDTAAPKKALVKKATRPKAVAKKVQRKK